MGTPRSDITRTMSNTAFDIGTPFSDFRRPASGEHCKHPSRWQIIQLWRAFINNVDPVLKVLHLPTTEVSVFKAANDPTGNDHGHNALLFSIYLVATTSLAPSDVTAILGRPKQEALLEFKCGLEQSLAAANYLESPTMVTVQAMGMYVVSKTSCNSLCDADCRSRDVCALTILDARFGHLAASSCAPQNPSDFILMARS